MLHFPLETFPMEVKADPFCELIADPELHVIFARSIRSIPELELDTALAIKGIGML
jgi:hypothetical protein